jgi:hypothetical protein
MGGLWSAGLDVGKAYTSVRDSKAGLIKPKDADEAVTGGALGAVFLPLDFMGSGTVLIGGAALAVKGVQALSRKTVGKFAASSVASGALKSKSVSAGELAKLAKQAAGENGQNVETINRLGLQVDAAGRELLGRPPTEVDERAFNALSDSRLLGSSSDPAVPVGKDYAEMTKNMSTEERAAYASRLEAIAATAKAGGSSETVDPARAVAAGRLAVALAAEPEFKAAAEILQAKSGWGQRAIENFREVVVAAIALAKGAGKASKEAVSTRFKKALAKITGESPDSPRIQTLCDCGGICPRAASLDVENAEPVYVACVNQANLPTNLLSDLPTGLRSMSEASAH